MGGTNDVPLGHLLTSAWLKNKSSISVGPGKTRGTDDVPTLPCGANTNITDKA